MSLIPRLSFFWSPAAPVVAALLFATTVAAGGGCAKISKDPGMGTGTGATTGSGGRGGIINPGSGGATPIPMDPVTGSKMGPGFNAGDMGKLDGAPSGGQLSIAYPLNGAIFPSNFGPVTVQVPRQQGQEIARITFTGANQLDLKYYDVCATGAVGGGCNITLDSELTKLFIYPSSMDDVTMTVRLSSKSGSNLSESEPIKIAWANVPLSGGLYYWTTINPGAVPGYTAPDPMDPRGTAVMRYVFDGNIPKRELVWSDRGSPYTTPQFGESPPAQPGTDPSGLRPAWGEGRCIGCHAISPNGKFMAFSIGGSDASSWAILNIASPPTLNELDPTASPGVPATDLLNVLKRYRKGNFASFTTFGPNSDLIVNMYRGKLTLRGLTFPALPVVKDDLFAAATTERKSDPFWSPDPAGSFFAFTSYDPSQDTQTSRFNGDTKTGGQIWVATADANGPHDDAKILVPRQAGVTSYYPAISNDARMLVFNQSKCSGPANPGGYGTGPCDGYDDITASLWLTDPQGSTKPIPLTRANGGDQNSNSWPRWSPDNGLFRGQKLYWLAFSSRRPYGLQVNAGGGSAAKPQLWFAAILTGDEFSTDPSRAPVWLPKQNLDETNANPTGNHVPQWVKFAVAIE